MEESDTPDIQRVQYQGVKGLSTSANMIFSQVLATIAMEMLEYLPGDKELFLRGLVPQDIEVHHNSETGNLCLYGMLDEIVKCQERLAGFLTENGACIDDKYSELTGQKSKMYVDVGVNCNIQICDIKLESLCPDDSVEKSLERHIAATEVESPSIETKDDKPNDAELDTNEEIGEVEMSNTDKGSFEIKTVRSRKGRPIKRPYIMESVDTFDDGEEKFGDELEENNPVVPEKKFRRYFRSKRRQSGRQFKSKEKISVENVRRLVEQEKKKEKSEREKGNLETETQIEGNKTSEVVEPGVLQNIFMNDMSEETAAKLFLEMKDLDSRRKIKKYYEDRMPFRFFCDKCSFKSKRESHFQAHMTLHKNNPNMELYKCDECSFTCIRRAILNRHLISHKEMSISCMICTYKTVSQKQLDIHLKKHGKNYEKLNKIPAMRCDVCNFTTLSKSALMSHIESHAQFKGGERWYNCTLCNYKSKRKEHLVRHQHNVHSNNRPFLCDLCGAAFKRVDALAAHKITHLDRSKRKLPFSCAHCKKAFKSQAHLKEHSAVHTTVRSFQCHICGQMFKTRSVQRRHQQNIHFNPRSHKCSHCNKEFNTKYAFQRHLRIHDGDPADHPPTQIQPSMAVDEKADTEQQVELEDENMSAIQTITLVPENLNEYRQTLETVSDQSTSGIGEIYIQGLEGMDMEKINIVNVPGQDVQQIFVPNSTDQNTILASGEHVKHIYITPKSADEENSAKKSESGISSDFVKQILMASESGNLNVAGLKELYVQSENGAETVRHILIPSVENSGNTDFTDQGDITAEIVDEKQQNLMIQNLDSENVGTSNSETVKATVGDQTFEIRIENGQAVLTLATDDVGQGGTSDPCQVIAIQQDVSLDNNNIV